MILTFPFLIRMANLEDNVGKITLVATGDGRIIVGKFYNDRLVIIESQLNPLVIGS